MATPATGARRVVLGAARDKAFIHFDQARQRHALQRDHGPAQLGGEQPRGLVGAQTELLLELQRRDPVGVRGHQIGGPEPRGQRQLGAVHHRTGPHRGLLATLGAFMGVGLCRERPSSATAAGRTDEACRPAQGGQVGGAGILVWKTLLELQQGTGEVGRFWASRGHYVRFVF